MANGIKVLEENSPFFQHVYGSSMRRPYKESLSLLCVVPEAPMGGGKVIMTTF